MTERACDCGQTPRSSRDSQPSCPGVATCWAATSPAKTFLSVYTPTFRRPTLLAQCRASVLSQTEPVQHVIVHDDVGIGIDGDAPATSRTTPQKCTGEYVMVLSDDNVLLDEHFACGRSTRTHRSERTTTAPDVVMFKGLICGHDAARVVGR